AAVSGVPLSVSPEIFVLNSGVVYDVTASISHIGVTWKPTRASTPSDESICVFVEKSVKRVPLETPSVAFVAPASPLPSHTTPTAASNRSDDFDAGVCA